MALEDRDWASIRAFREYIIDALAIDERYGSATRYDAPDESMLITKFEAGPSCWFIMAIRPADFRVRVGFLTDDPAIYQELLDWIEETGESIEAIVGVGFTEAGLEWSDPPVETGCEGGGCTCFNTRSTRKTPWTSTANRSATKSFGCWRAT